MSRKKLAIVIPAFKSIFFENTLESIANQTCQDFTLYVGNDDGDKTIGTLVEKFSSQVEIVYQHFNENLGLKDLVAHWERCIDMVAEEEWIWLFSDDDLMDSRCVEYFYQNIAGPNKFDLFHFNIQVIDQSGHILRTCNFPALLTVEDYFYGRSSLNYRSYVCEYVFRKSHFLELGRFPNFDLAWGSDDALWIRLGRRNGIKTINGPKVNWRKSEHNISPNVKDLAILNRKFFAKIEYAKWIFKQAKENKLRIEISKVEKILETAFIEDIKESETLTLKMLVKIFNRFYSFFNNRKLTGLKFVYVFFYRSYRVLIKWIKLFVGLFLPTMKTSLKVS